MDTRLASTYVDPMGESWRRRRGVLLGNPLVVDSALAVFVSVIAVAQQTSSIAETAATRSTGLTFAALFPLALIVRRRVPVVVLAVMFAVLAVWAGTGAATRGAGIPVLVALYTVAAYRRARVSAGVAILAAVGVYAVTAQSADVTSNLVEVVASCAGAWWLGTNTRTRRSQRDALA